MLCNSGSLLELGKLWNTLLGTLESLEHSWNTELWNTLRNFGYQTLEHWQLGWESVFPLLLNQQLGLDGDELLLHLLGEHQLLEGGASSHIVQVFWLGELESA